MKVHEDEPFPCDLIIIESALEKGQCFIETSSLDGEKNLKPKGAHPLCVGIVDEHTCRFGGCLTYEFPNPRLYNFDGSL